MVGGTSYFLGFGKAALTARGQCIQNVQNILKIQLSEFLMLRKSSRTGIFNCAFCLKKTRQDPLNTSSLFIKIWSRIIIWPICTKTIEREQLIPFSPTERQPGIPAEPRVTLRVISSAELCWHFPFQEQSSAKALPAQIRVEKPTEDVVIPKIHWWNTWMLNKSWRPAQEQEAAAERELWDQRLEILSWAHDTNSHFLPSQRIFSLTNPFLWNMMRASMNSLGQDRPWNNDEIIIEFIVLVQSFLYIFKGDRARLYGAKLTYIFLGVPEQDCIMKSWLTKV